MLTGKKTIIGSLVVSLIGLIWSLDQFFPGEWLTRDQYEAAAAMIAGFTGVSMRLGIQKAEEATRLTQPQ